MKNYNNEENGILEVSIPTEIANLHLADPSLVMYYKNLEDRILWIDRDVDASLFEEIKQILRWNKEDKDIPVKDRKKIYIFIHSYGGTLDSAFAMVDIMNLSKTPIVTVNMNTAMSAGCLIFINGNERYCMKMSTALIHQGSSGGGQGTFSQCEAQQNNYKRQIKMMEDNIFAHTKISSRVYGKHKKDDWYLPAEDQIKYGLAEKIIENIEEIL